MRPRFNRLFCEQLELRRLMHGGHDDIQSTVPEMSAPLLLSPQALLVPGSVVTEGPVLGAVTSQTGKIFVRTSAESNITVEYSTHSAFTSSQVSPVVRTLASRDLTAVVPLHSLIPETQYFYRVYANGVLQQLTPHKFTTFPTPGTSRDLTFAVAADVINVRANPGVAAPAYARIADENPAFLLQIGDFDHRNPTSLSAMRTMHRDVLGPRTASGRDFANEIAPNMPLFHVYDDHDYGMDNGDKTFAGRAAALQAFQEYYPTPPLPNPQAGIWHSFAAGDVDVFMLDTRSQRDPDSATDGPSKSMLDGDNIPGGQKAWFKSGLLASTATWKFVISTVPFNPTAKPNDSWGAFATERAEILNFIESNSITGVIFVSGDMHTGGAIDDGTNSGLPEINVPHTNATASQIATGDPGVWSEGLTSGKGSPGYGLIKVTANPPTVVLQNKGVDGTVRSSLRLTLPASTDALGPTISQLSISPAVTNLPPAISALASDVGRGGSRVAQAEYFIDTVGAPGTGRPLVASDGLFDTAAEHVSGSVDGAAFSALSGGSHTVFVRAKDALANWGPVAAATFTKSVSTAAAEYYLSLSEAGTVLNSDGTSFRFAASDIVKLTIEESGHYSYTLFLNGADIGLTQLTENLDAFSVRPDGSLLVSTSGGFSVLRTYSSPGVGSGTAITGGGEDVLRFTPSRTGSTTTGSWSLYFDGSTAGLAGTTENVDAIGVLPDGRLLLSTVGAYTVPGLSGRDEDLIAFDLSARTWSLYLDGQDIGLSGNEGEDVDAVFVEAPAAAGAHPHLLLSTRGEFAVPGATGSNEDVVRFRPATIGTNTSGTFDAELVFNGSAYGLSAFDLSGFQPLVTFTLQTANLQASALTAPPGEATNAKLPAPAEVAQETIDQQRSQQTNKRELAIEEAFAQYGLRWRPRSRPVPRIS